MAGNKLAPNPWFVDHRPEIYMSMGLTAERLQQKYGISREDAGRVRATAAIRTRCSAQAEGKFDDEIVPVEVETRHERLASRDQNTRFR